MTEIQNEGPSKEPERQAREKKKRKKPSVKERAVRLVIHIMVLAAVITVLVTVVGGVFICHTNDMYPALRDGDLVITFRLGAYHSGDIVAYDHGGKTCFGRIVGEPTDEIYIDEGGTYTINGITPYEMIYYETRTRASDQMTFPYVIGEGEYFVLADYRAEGMDSRNIGPLSKLKGKVILQFRRRGF